MSIDTVHTAEEDAQAVTEAFLAGRPIPPDLAARVEERAAELREQIFRERGYLNIAVSSVRESREAGH
jgi:hypothetical protein